MKLRLISFLVWLAGAVAFAGPPNWEVNPHNFEHNMSMTGVLAVKDSVFSATHGLKVAAFRNGECVGMAEAMEFSVVEELRVIIMVYGNKNDGAFSLQAYLPMQDMVVHVHEEESYNFTPNASFGNLEEPLVWKSNTSVFAPTVDNPISDKNVEQNFIEWRHTLNNVFSDADGDPLSFTAVSSNTACVQAAIINNELVITETGLGTSTITITAKDAQHQVSFSFDFTVNEAKECSFTVTDGTQAGNLPVEGAEITITDSENNIVADNLFTDINGYAAIDLPAETYSFRVYKPGFVYFHGNADLSTGNVHKDVVLQNDYQVGVEKAQAGEFSIYPNPTTGVFYIKSAQAVVSVRIYNGMGRELPLASANGKQRNSFSTNNLAPGIYLVRVNNNKMAIRLIVQ